MINKTKNAVSVVKYEHQYGDGKIQISYDTKLGKVTVFRAVLKLRQELGELHNIKNKLVISKAGYDRINTIANVNIFPYPSEIMIEGRLERNPYIQINPRTNLVQRIIGSFWGFAVSPVGNFQIATASLNYDLSAYSQQKLIKMLQNNSNAFKIGVPEYCPFCPDIDTFQGEDGTWKAIDREKQKSYVYKILEAGDGVWCDQTHPDYIEFLEDSRDRIKFAERIATSILKRNIIKEIIGKTQLSLVEGSIDKKTAVCEIVVYGYKHELERNEIESMIEKASKGELRDAEFISVTGESTEDAEFEEIMQEEKEIEEVQTEKKPEKPQEEIIMSPKRKQEEKLESQPEQSKEIKAKMKIVNQLAKNYYPKMSQKLKDEFDTWLISDQITIEKADYWIKKFGEMSVEHGKL